MSIRSPDRMRPTRREGGWFRQRVRLLRNGAQDPGAIQARAVLRNPIVVPVKVPVNRFGWVVGG